MSRCHRTGNVALTYLFISIIFNYERYMLPPHWLDPPWRHKPPPPGQIGRIRGGCLRSGPSVMHRARSDGEQTQNIGFYNRISGEWGGITSFLVRVWRQWRF